MTKDADDLIPIPAHLVEFRSERSPLRMAVSYPRETGAATLSKGELQLSSGRLPASAVVGYAIEPAIYRVRFSQGAPLGAPAEDEPQG